MSNDGQLAGPRERLEDAIGLTGRSGIAIKSLVYDPSEPPMQSWSAVLEVDGCGEIRLHNVEVGMDDAASHLSGMISAKVLAQLSAALPAV